MLVGERKLTHSYPHCWRCHNPVIFRATEQWFIGLDHDDLRKKALEEIAKVKWTPEWGDERIHDMVAERPDWCISRQRFWGVPLIIFYCDACGKQLRDYQALAPRAAVFRARRRGRVVHAFRRRASSAGNEMLVRRGEVEKRNRRSGRVVRFGLDASRRAQRKGRPDMARGCVPRRARPISRLVPQFACWSAWASRGRAPYRASRDARLDARRKGRADVEIARQRHVSQGNLREVGRGFAARLGRVAGLHRRHAHVRRDDDAARRGLSQNPQHLPLRAFESFRVRSRARFRSRCRAMGNRRLDASPHGCAGPPMPGVVREFRISSRLPCASTISAPWT